MLFKTYDNSLSIEYYEIQEKAVFVAPKYSLVLQTIVSVVLTYRPQC